MFKFVSNLFKKQTGNHRCHSVNLFVKHFGDMKVKDYKFWTQWYFNGNFETNLAEPFPIRLQKKVYHMIDKLDKWEQERMTIRQLVAKSELYLND